MIDCATYIGPFPFRELPHPDAEVLVRVLAREGLHGAWVGYLPAAWQRDAAPANASLLAALAPHAELRAAPIVRPDWPQWERTLRDLVEQGAELVELKQWSEASPLEGRVARPDRTLTVT